MSQPTAQPVIRIREEKSVTTKENSIATEIVKKPKKLCRDRVDMLKIKMLVAIRKFMLRQLPEAEVYKEVGAENFVSRNKTFPSQQENYC